MLKLTAPITGPFAKDEYISDIPDWSSGRSVYKTWSRHRVWSRQAKPYNLPLNFDSVTRSGESRYSSSGPYGTWFGSWTEAIASSPDQPALDQNLYNRAYARFLDKWKNAVEGGVATAEGRQAMSMVTQRLSQLGSFTRHLAQGKIGLAAGDLGLTVTGGATGKPRKSRLPPRVQQIIDRHEASRSRRETARGFSQLYLEFHFGWSPLIKDIYDAIETLNNPFKNFHVSASATGSIKDPNAISTHNWEDASWRYSESRTGSYLQTVGLRADVVITNPNLAMMQQFGILNPAAIAWELVPFSFVLDWFVNVGDYLNSFTDFAGVNLLNASWTTFTRWNGTYEHNSIAKNPAAQNTVRKTWWANTVHCFRRLGLGTGPTLRLRTPKPWGVRRGLAAASLLVQQFPRAVIDENAVSLAKKRTAFRSNVFPSFHGKYW